MAKIFISYRRSDSQDFTGRLYDYLVAEFGREAVFKDVDTLVVGKKFDQQLNEALDQSEIVLVVIGPTWLEELHRRAEESDEPDFVYKEVAAALARPETHVVPVLIGDTKLPPSKSLPKALRPLRANEAHTILPDPRFRDDVRRLIARLRTACPDLPTAPPAQTEGAEKKERRWRQMLAIELRYWGALVAVLFVAYWYLRYGFLVRDLESVKTGMWIGFSGVALGLGYLSFILKRLTSPAETKEAENQEIFIIVGVCVALAWIANRYTVNHLPNEPDAFANQVRSALVDDLGLGRAIPAIGAPVPPNALYRSSREDWTAGYYIDSDGVLHWPRLRHLRGWGRVNLRDTKTNVALETRWTGSARVRVGSPVPTSGWTEASESVDVAVFSQEFDSEVEAKQAVSEFTKVAPALPVERRRLSFGSRWWEVLLIIFVGFLLLVFASLVVVFRMSRKSTKRKNHGASRSRTSRRKREEED